MVGWHHQLDGHGFVWTLGVGDGQGGLACCVHAVVKSRSQKVQELSPSFSADQVCGFDCLILTSLLLHL